VRVVKPALSAVALLALAISPASAATVQGQWTMTIDAGTTHNKMGGANLRLRGDYTQVKGAVGRAIKFAFNGHAALGTATSNVAFNPGTAPFAVAAYFKTRTVPTFGHYSPNVVQKGFFTSRGQWKMQLLGTRRGTIADCRFTGSKLHRGDVVTDSFHRRLDNRHWHEVVCWRKQRRYGITVDGRATSRVGAIGSIRNSRPLRVANKAAWAGIADQFRGRLDCVAYAKGRGARVRAMSRVPC
jgi:hypothetical protein